MDYETIKRVAKEAGVSVKDLIALSPQNDPFYVGRKAELAAAEWFAGLWQKFGYGDNVHLRRVHYQAVSQDPPVMKPNGTRYENTLNDWGYLCNAGKWARYLDLVSPKAFVDRRNPDAVILARWETENDWGYNDPTPEYKTVDVNGQWEWYELPDVPDLDNIGYEDVPDLPDFDVSGYDDGIQQDYHIEVWIEKSTMHDVILPLCKKYNVNLVAGAGEMSITSVVDFMDRVKESQRPARILYISDYDPAGLGMPISVARKIEFFQRRNGDGDMDIRLQPIALTSEQVREYDLPRVPVKDTDKRKANWERDHGKGQVELDALEALYPGDLARIIEDTILCYYDPRLVREARQQRERLEADLDIKRAEVLESHHAGVDRLTDDYQKLRDDFDEIVTKFSEMAAEFAPDIEAYQARLQKVVERGQELYDSIRADLKEAGDLDTDDYPLPSPDLPEERNGVLYLSERDYLEQLEAYNAYRHNLEIEK